MNAPLLAVENLSAGYGDSRVLFDVSLAVGKGEVITLLGRNGMGKTTTVHTILGIVPAQGGSIAFNGKPLTGQPSYRIAQHGIGLVPEGRQVFPNLTVRENLVATAAVRFPTETPWTIDRVLDLFPSLRPRFDSSANLLSGGEQQMLAIGRALMTNPLLLVFDEATEGLAPLIRRQIWHVIDLIRSTGTSILIIDKNVQALAKIATRHYIIERGRIVWTGSSGELQRDESLKQRYLSV